MYKSSVAPLAVIVLLAAPLSYVGGYCALVTPQGTEVVIPDRCGPIIQTESYRAYAERAGYFFGPLERLDRSLRPNAWRR